MNYIDWMRSEVMDAMPDYQVVAIYHRFKKEGKFEKSIEKPRQQYHKMSLFEWAGDKLSNHDAELLKAVCKRENTTK